MLNIKCLLFNCNISSSFDNNIQNDFLIPEGKPYIEKPKNTESNTESIIMRGQCTSKFYHDTDEVNVNYYILSNQKKLDKCFLTGKASNSIRDDESAQHGTTNCKVNNTITIQDANKALINKSENVNI